MAFELDYENTTREGITLRVEKKDGEQFVKNYAHFGWKLISRLKVDGYDDLYSYILERRKDDVRYEAWRRLENEFQAAGKALRFRNQSGLFFGNLVNPDYLDYQAEKPFMEEYTLTKGRMIFNTLLCFVLIGFLLWADSLYSLTKNKKARRIAEVKAQCLDIFRRADEL